MNVRMILWAALWQAIFIGLVALYKHVLNLGRIETLIFASFDVLIIALAEIRSKK